MSRNSGTINSFVLTVSCESSPGIVAGVSSYLANSGCDIVELSQFDDKASGKFFMRVVFAFLPEVENTIESMRSGFVEIEDEFGLEWAMYEERRPSKVLIMVSKFDHCLDDLLYRHHKGELNIEITAVVSNHLDLRPMVEREGIRFVYLPVTKENKLSKEEELLNIVEETGTELVVLARYMQVLSDQLCEHLHGRAINIHHSFLPGFKGAKPYHQAFERGVKLIGATAHYVTAELDEGPIIEQSVQSVDHAYYPDDLVALGRDTETMALARAVKLHIEHRVFLSGNKTVIFK
ncbi:formyltetrahydrofolate deformylase [Pseudomaricurvus alkylphenolicus]|uniref:formyltetrahydrofolate deformylase n=1 Tax=Pseudomaricurvus alkylphenolicus TaxID=1306991 RepID=UPI00141E257A|nr:formyltetrahydrofolate deformylase [Pseudomaricurvus alkylphenolicus]NIB43521.1 formyltetrahydrofolate deformylase [Pseudomaricurvus alkylphenolicus]